MNSVTNNYGTVGGGWNNTASGNSSIVGGGSGNTASGDRSTVDGGDKNTAIGYISIVGGGDNNTASSIASTVGGGTGNTASGRGATVPGGDLNVAEGDYSFAAGRRAKTGANNGVFIWGDNTLADITAPAANTFIARASGGFWFGTSSTPTLTASSMISTSTGAHLTNGGIWTDNSDRNLKENFEKLDGKEILEKVASTPVTQWNYKVEDDSIRHIGPMAQDFYASFGIGNDNKHIASLDSAGVALAAIQGLYDVVKEKDAKIADLESRLLAIESMLGSITNAGFVVSSLEK